MYNVHMKKITGKRIATDLAGYGCLLLVPFVGWLPGPGGIPLILAGLGLLSIHNPWAKNLLHQVRAQSESLRDVFFPDKKIVQWAWDFAVIALLVIGYFIDLKTSGLFFRGLSIGMYAVASTTFLFNRHRLRWLEKLKFKKR